MYIKHSFKADFFSHWNFPSFAFIWNANRDCKKSSLREKLHTCFWLHRGNFKFAPSLKFTCDHKFNEFPRRFCRRQSSENRKKKMKNFHIYAEMREFMMMNILASFLWCFFSYQPWRSASHYRQICGIKKEFTRWKCADDFSSCKLCIHRN